MFGMAIHISHNRKIITACVKTFYFINLKDQNSVQSLYYFTKAGFLNLRNRGRAGTKQKLK